MLLGGDNGDTNTQPHQCSNRGCECVYTASKRGGARRRKKLNSGEARIVQSPPNELRMLSKKTHKHCSNISLVTGPAPVVSLATPGAGLLQRDDQLDFEMDFDFDPNLLGNSESLTMDNAFLPLSMAEDTFNIKLENSVVRTYSNDEDM